MKSWTNVLLAAALLFTTPLAVRAANALEPPPGLSSRIDAIRHRGVLRVAVLSEFPWLIKNPSANAAPFRGPAWRLAEEYAHRLGVSIETTPVTSGEGAWLQKRLVRAARDGIPGNLTDLATGEILAHRADVVPIDKFFFRTLQRKVPGLASVPKDCLASQELPVSIAMAIDKGQPAFLDWLRAVAASIKPEVDAEMARTVQAGP